VLGAPPLQFRRAALLLWLNAVGFGLPCLQAIGNLPAGRDIPYIMGFPAYGRGPFEHYGLPTTVPLLLGFLVVCLLEGLAGWLVWRGKRRGAILALLLLPAGTVYWWGFALPFRPIFALTRTFLIIQRWTSLS
jgi:hypothetical protein